jgi:hypothetical protein
MRRQQKLALKEQHLTHIFSRWLHWDADDLEPDFLEFKAATDATPQEMTHFRKALADRMVAHIEKLTDEGMKVKRPSLSSMLQKRHHMDYFKGVPKTLLSTRYVYYNELVDWLSGFYEDRIIENLRVQYLALLRTGSTANEIYTRIFNNADAAYVDRYGVIWSWRRIDNRLETLVQEWVLQKGSKAALQQFSNDKQNIHTIVINKQTNDTLKLLFAVPLNGDQCTIEEIDAMWQSMLLTASYSYNSVIRDIREWAAKSMICEPDDYLYRKTLQFLWAKIRSCAADLQKELAKRLYEECRDAVGMCAQGHIARLANVFVGYDAAFTAPISEKEMFQQKIAEINALETDSETKIQSAIRLMEDVHMPAAERQVWLDAFKGA